MSKTIQHNPNFSYRPDIDGLRAVAILLVIIFHAYPKFLRGGFIGVDIFFVISGYLITSIILKNQSQNNFSLLDFYSRRIRRIFPALIVVLTFCLVAGWYALLGDEYERLGKHIAAGSIYISNFVLQSEAGYFDTDSELKPLLHLWSLAIEEQFYLVFPLLLIVGKRFQISPLLIISVSLIFSFLANIIQIHDKPTDVFFFPYSRAWELLVGSLVAYLSIHSIAKNQAEKFANPLSWLGIILILSAWIFLDSKKILFPSWWALLPTFGAASLIFAGDKAWFNRKILASKIAIFIGLISYPLYLWHWVLLSFLKITEVEKLNSRLRFSILVVSMILAWLTYYFVEKNLRFQKSKFISLGLLVSLLLIGSIGYFVTLQKGYPSRYKIEVEWTAGELGADDFRKKGLISQKSCEPKYKMLSPSDEPFFCLEQIPEKLPTALLLGDSHANHLYLSLAKRTDLTGGNLLNLGMGGCFPFFDLPQKESCQQFMNNSLQMAMMSPSINTLIFTFYSYEPDNIPLHKKLFNQNSDGADESFGIFSKSMKKTLQQLLAANKKVIFVLDTPDLEFNPNACMSRPWRLDKLAEKTLCAIPRSQVDLRQKKCLETVKAVLSEFPNVTVLDPLPAFCDDNYCWAIKDKKMLYRDSHHLNEVGAIYLGEYFEHQINPNDKAHDK
jgi:peptidoglycan/LPS O-acetylase OafA/YrhL